MRILLIGSGGREHALAWKLSQSPLLEELWIAPGNPGTAALGENLAIGVEDTDALVAFAREKEVSLVVVGPEAPLVLGLADRLTEAEIPCFGPTASAAELEGSKAFCKALLVRHRVPTAAYRVYQDLNPAISYLEGGASYPVVVKASGLAAGKGVFICADPASARQAVRALLEDRALGDAGSQVVVEEFLQGPEASAFVLTDGRTLLPFETCQDHKQLLDGGRGPNTGGMGAVCPNPEVGDRSRDAIERQILLPVVHAMNHEGRRFCGVLFAGLKLTPAGPKVLEFNVRFGDPECQVLMMRLRGDLLPILHACATSRLEELEAPEWDPRPAVTVILASDGYPGSYAKGKLIEGLEDLRLGEDLQVFQGGTALDEEGRLRTAGGRVLAVTALGSSLEEARRRAYDAAEQIHFEGRILRQDIGAAAVAAAARLA